MGMWKEVFWVVLLLDLINRRDPDCQVSPGSCGRPDGSEGGRHRGVLRDGEGGGGAQEGNHCHETIHVCLLMVSSFQGTECISMLRSFEAN